MSNNINPSNWKYRRRYLIAVTAFTMVFMVLALILRPETSVAEAAIEMGFLGLMGYVGTYVFGAVWDHFNTRKTFHANAHPNSSEMDTRSKELDRTDQP